MTCYLIRHGKDDDSVRGGWSASPLTTDGIAQAEKLASQLAGTPNNICRIFTSDLRRAKQTAEILSRALELPMEEVPAFRETNNGLLAGMDNALAAKQYPGLYWNTLEWDQRYPGGESPHEFYTRVSDAWAAFKHSVQSLDGDVILVTHGGVINVIQCIENGVPYSNRENLYPLGHAEMASIIIPSTH